MSTYAEFPTRYYSLLTRSPGTILLQCSRFDAENSRSYLFCEPERILSATALDEVPVLFSQIEDALGKGAFVAGYLAYECGEHFERVGDGAPQETGVPLAAFGVYPQAYIFDHCRSRFVGKAPDPLLADVQPACSGSPQKSGQAAAFELQNLTPEIESQDYARKIDLIKEYIRAGDTYQVNFTDKLTFDFFGSPVALFAALQEQQRVAYSAYLNFPELQILSFSPELFFRIRNGRITTRPMKGTAGRGRDLEEDSAISTWLQNDPKNCSENVMIVDLLRNDLGRICEFGSVKVEHLFAVEKYETLLQMTSTVSGQLRPGLRYYDIFKALYPCGSITGAPKIRSREIIRELEREPRGVYCGAIGFISPQGEACFNVAIRTLALKDGHGEMGVGSGIVIDSVAQDEYRECLLKGAFLTLKEEPFQLLESILWDGGYPLLELHLHRLGLSAQYFEYAFDHSALMDQLKQNERNLHRGTRYKIRLLLQSDGKIALENASLKDDLFDGRLLLSPARVASSDRFLRHKTTRRQFYDQMYTQARKQGYDEVLFLNERDEVTEGAISNIFIEQGGRLLTSPVSCGLLPGIFRRHLLDTNPKAIERVLHIDDLRAADAIYICNAVRGLRRVVLDE